MSHVIEQSIVGIFLIVATPCVTEDAPPQASPWLADDAIQLKVVMDRAAERDSPDLLGSIWPKMKREEKRKFYSNSIKHEATRCIDWMVKAGFNLLEWDRNGSLIVFESESNVLFERIVSVSGQAPGGQGYSTLIERILTGIGCEGTVKTLDLNIDKSVKVNIDDFISVKNKFLDGDDVEISIEIEDNDRIEFSYKKNWMPLSGIMGTGYFVRHRGLWDIHWTSSVEG